MMLFLDQKPMCPKTLDVQSCTKFLGRETIEIALLYEKPCPSHTGCGIRTHDLQVTQCCLLNLVRPTALTTRPLRTLFHRGSWELLYSGLISGVLEHFSYSSSKIPALISGLPVYQSAMFGY